MDQPGVLTIIRVENNYTVTLDLPIRGTSTPGGTVWVTDEDRRDLIQAIDATTETINRPPSMEPPFRGHPAQLTETPKVRSLRNLGQLIYGIFLPPAIQEGLRRLRIPLILSTNDPAIPWELLHDGQEFLALRQPLARRLVGRLPHPGTLGPFSKSPAFLFIANPMEDLPESKAEALYLIEALTQHGIRCDLLQGSRATYINVQDALRSGRYTVIHYTGHAFFDPRQPERSGLRLAEGRVLPANQIERLLQGHPLVFLNACSSGREGAQGIDERLPVSYIGSYAEGLASAFILGGALAFIGTLWPVFDEGSRQFALHFYQRLLDGWDIGEALRHTRNILHAQRPTDVTWISFILYGDPLLQLPLKAQSVETLSAFPFEETSGAASLYEQALTAFHQGQWEEAIRLFNQVLALIGPYRDTVAHLAEANRRARIAELLNLAQTAFDQERYTEAMVFCADILTLESGERTALTLLRRAQEAQTLYNDYTQGQAALESGDWTQAIARLERVVARQSDYKDAQRLLALAHENHQVEVQAAELYTQAQRQAEQKAWMQAADTLEDLLALTADYRDALPLLFQVRAELESEEQLASLYQQAQAALTREDQPTLLATLEKIARLQPGYWIVDSLLTQVREEVAQAQEARRRAEQLAALYEQATKAVQDGQWRRALGLLNRIEALQPGYRDVGTLRAQAQAELAAQRPWTQLLCIPSPTPMARPAMEMAGNALLALLLVLGGLALFLAFGTRGRSPGSQRAASLSTPEPTTIMASRLATTPPTAPRTRTATPVVEAAIITSPATMAVKPVATATSVAMASPTPVASPTLFFASPPPSTRQATATRPFPTPTEEVLAVTGGWAIELLQPRDGVQVQGLVTFRWTWADSLSPGEIFDVRVCKGESCQPRFGKTNVGETTWRWLPDEGPGIYRWQVVVIDGWTKQEKGIRSDVRSFEWRGE